MNTISKLGLAASLLLPALTPNYGQSPSNTIVLKETGVKNLRIQTTTVESRAFESTVFAIGRIEEIPVNHSVLSSRIAGRVVAIHAFEGDYVTKGQLLVEVESRQPGNPPPTIELRAAQDG